MPAGAQHILPRPQRKQDHRTFHQGPQMLAKALPLTSSHQEEQTLSQELHHPCSYLMLNKGLLHHIFRQELRMLAKETVPATFHQELRMPAKVPLQATFQ